MTPPFPRPGYIPEPVWSLYLELLTPDPDKPGAPLLSRPRYDAPIRRLFGVHRESTGDRNGRPEIARTWRRLAKTPRPAQDWRCFFDLLWSLPDTFDADSDARAAVAACRDLAPKIADLADALSNALERYRNLAERHAITCPDALLLPEALIGESAARGRDPEAYARHCEPGWVAGSAPGVAVEHLPTVPELLRTLAEVCNATTPTCHAPAGAHANTREVSMFAAPVRHFDERLTLLARSTGARFEPSDLDTSHILTAVLGRSVSRQAVAAARNKKGKN